jgi:hypothetical protein
VGPKGDDSMAHEPGAAPVPIPDIEVQSLRKLALRVCLYLSSVLIASFFLGIFLLSVLHGAVAQLLGVALVGAAGSAVGALTSCLDRYANGFELELTGQKVPPAKENEKKETFNRRMARWFFFRPLLGLVMAPVLIWGLTFFTGQAEKFTESPIKLGFTAFMGGLLAKSVIDLIKNLFKNVFKA